MSEEKPKELFTPEFVDHIERARELNEDKSISGDIYFHPTEDLIVVKSIDLSMPHPLCEVNNRPSSPSEERWIEAYLINQAKKTDWRLPLAGKEYRFLCSQLKFRQDRTKGEKQGRILDLLLYDEKEERLVVLELKREADKKALDTAKAELDDYKAKLEELIATEKKAIVEAFNLGSIKKDVVGCVVWPANDKSDKELGLDELGKYRLIEYTKPWKEFKEVKEVGKDLEIEFTRRPPTR